MLLIKAKGGLGNRMLSTASAIAYAEATKRDWCIDWRDGVYAPVGTNAVNHLFQTSKRDCVDQIISTESVNPTVWASQIELSVDAVISASFPTKHSSQLIYRKLSAPITAAPSKDAVEVFWSYTSKFGRIKRFLTTEQQKLGRDKVLAKVLNCYLSPSPRIMSAVDTFVCADDNRTLGVHIRFTDLKVPIDKIISTVAIELKKFKYKSIFLATDSLYAEELFQQNFPNVITQNRRYCESNSRLHLSTEYPEKLKDADIALVDMYALSRCSGLVYCSRSTFSETSRILGQFERERVVDVDRYNLFIQVKKLLREYV